MKKQGIIIGLGKIGMLYDYKPNDRILTHSTAIRKINSLKLIYGVDKNSYRRRQFTKKFNTPSYSSILSSNQKIDFVIISSSTNSHYKLIKYVIKFLKVKLIIVEKPFCKNYKEAKEITKIAEKKNIKIFVNYIRSFDKVWLKIKQKIYNKKIVGNINFYKDNYINGSHFIHLCMLLFGKPKKCKKINNLKFTIFFKNAKITFNKTYKRSNTSIQLKSKKFEIFDQNLFKIKIINKSVNYILNNMKSYQLNFYRNIFNDKFKNIMKRRNLKYALEVHKVLEKIK